MKSKMKVCLIIFALLISLLVPSIVNAATDPQVTLDKTSSVRQGDVVTVTVIYPTEQTNTSGIYFKLKFDTDNFDITSVNAYNKNNDKLRIVGGSTFSKVPGEPVTPGHYETYNISAGIASDSTDINKVEVQLTAKKDITEYTNVIVSHVATSAMASENNLGSKKTQRIQIDPLIVEPEQPNPQPVQPAESTNQSVGAPAPAPSAAPAATPVKDTTPKTGSVDVSLIATFVSIISLAGIVVVMKYSK